LPSHFVPTARAIPFHSDRSIAISLSDHQLAITRFYRFYAAPLIALSVFFFAGFAFDRFVRYAVGLAVLWGPFQRVRPLPLPLLIDPIV